MDALLEDRPLDGVVLIDYVGANVRGHTAAAAAARAADHVLHRSPGVGLALGDGNHHLLGFTDGILAIFGGG